MSTNANDLLHKLEQIEDLAQYALHETPSGLGKDHIKLIISLAKYLTTEIQLSKSSIR